MKTYNVALNIFLQKNVKVKANSSDEAKDFVTDVFCNTDIISFDEDNLISVDCVTDEEDVPDVIGGYDDEEEHLYDETY